MGKSSNGPPKAPAPPIAITDPVARSIAEANLRAFHTGDPTEIMKMLEGGLKAGEPPHPERSSRYVISVPLLAIDGTPCLGRDMEMRYGGEAQTIELVIGDAVYTVSLMQLTRVLHSLSCASRPAY